MKLTDIIAQGNRIVLKVGSSLLIDKDTDCLHQEWLNALVADIVHYKNQGKEILIISSGSIALGRRALKITAAKESLKLEEKQAAAAAGQIILNQAWYENFAEQNMNIAQILLTYDDTETRRNYLNARNTLLQLLKFDAIPLINENDTVATDELRYGDNDRLAARVAVMVEADLLLLLSDVDGLYQQNPSHHQHAQHVPLIADINTQIMAMVADTTDGTKDDTKDGTGGMATKIDAAKIAIAGGCQMTISDGRLLNPLRQEQQKFSLFKSMLKPQTARKQWIASGLDVKGSLLIDEGAQRALLNNRSLLAAGVVAVRGDFKRGALVSLLGQEEDGNGNKIDKELGKGLISYDSEDARKIMGHQSDDFETLIGYKGGNVLMHRDNLFLYE